MLKVDTYLVINSGIVSKLKNIKQFKLNLGQSLINNKNQFMPADVKIQKHYLYFKEIVNLVGYIGTLSIYTSNICERNTIILYNNAEFFKYILNDSLSIYDNINTAIDLFFTKIGLNKDINTEVKEEIKKEEIKKEEYIQSKSLSEMTEAERIEYARNIK